MNQITLWRMKWEFILKLFDLSPSNCFISLTNITFVYFTGLGNLSLCNRSHFDPGSSIWRVSGIRSAIDRHHLTNCALRYFRFSLSPPFLQLYSCLSSRSYQLFTCSRLWTATLFEHGVSETLSIYFAFEKNFSLRLRLRRIQYNVWIITIPIKFFH